MANAWMGGRVAMLAALALSVSGPVRAQTNVGSEAETLLRGAYGVVVEAELARAERRHADAVTRYKQAVSLFGRLQAEYPGWREDMVAYRVADCQNAIAMLESPAVVDAVVSASGSAMGTNAEARLQALVQELRMARSWLAPDDAAGGRMGMLEQDIARLRGERDRAVKEHQALARQVSKLEARLRRFDKADGRGARTNAVVMLPAVIRAETLRLARDGQYEAAFTLLREGIEVMPDRQEFDVLAAVTACRAGRFDMAVGILKPYDTRESANADAMLTLGTAWMGMGRIGEARVATERALALNPKSAEAHYNMAQIFLTLRPANPVEAEKHYQRARELGLEADPDFENNLRVAYIIARLKQRQRP